MIRNAYTAQGRRMYSETRGDPDHLTAPEWKYSAELLRA